MKQNLYYIEDDIFYYTDESIVHLSNIDNIIFEVEKRPNGKASVEIYINNGGVISFSSTDNENKEIFYSVYEYIKKYIRNTPKILTNKEQLKVVVDSLEKAKNILDTNKELSYVDILNIRDIIHVSSNRCYDIMNTL